MLARIIVALHCVLGVVLGCEPGWIMGPTQTFCYFCPTDGSILTWVEAARNCSTANGWLANLTDENERIFIKQTLLHTSFGPGAWLGGSDSHIEKDWRWHDGSYMNIHRFTWRRGKMVEDVPLNLPMTLFLGNPDNGGGLTTNEDCLLISSEKGTFGQLNDFRCSRKLPWICKAGDPVQTTLSPAVTSDKPEFVNITDSVECSSCSSDGGKTVSAEVVGAVVGSTIVAILVIILLAIVCAVRRHPFRRKVSVRSHAETSVQNYYEDAPHNDRPIEHKYTGLEQPTTRAHSTVHIYQSVNPEVQTNFGTRSKPHKVDNDTNGASNVDSCYCQIVVNLDESIEDSNTDIDHTKTGNGIPRSEVTPMQNQTTTTGPVVDSGYVEVLTPDSGYVDTSTSDSGYVDTSTPDSGYVDTSAPDLDYVDVSSPNSRPMEVKISTLMDGTYATPYEDIQNSSTMIKDNSADARHLASADRDTVKVSPEREGEMLHDDPSNAPVASIDRSKCEQSDRKQVDSNGYLLVS